MAKHRYINTKFWSDLWVKEKLNPLDRYLFLYFLTNEHTNIAGMYEIPLSIIAFETGIDREELQREMLKRLEPKVFYVDGWVCIVNFERHQVGRGNSRIEKGIELAKNEVPNEILSKFKDLIQMGYTYPLYESYKEHGRATNNRDTDSDTDSDSDPDSLQREKKIFRVADNGVNKIIKLFEPMNPSWERLVKNKTELEAAGRLLEKHGEEKLTAFLKILPEIISLPYAPRIVTPYQLEKKAGELKVFMNQENNKTKKGWTII